jgi:ABC-type Fe3+/spermidine/putrescine transport system ATPase subunit
VYVTHNQEEALTMSDRIAVMDEGLFEQVGPKLDVYANPATRFVASFVGSANRLEGELVEMDDRRARFEWGGNRIWAPCPSNAQAGDVVELFVKSERLSVRALGDATSPGTSENRLRGRLRDIIFKGQYSDYLVEIEHGAELVVSGSPDLRAIKPSDSVEVTWPVDAGDCFRVA